MANSGLIWIHSKLYVLRGPSFKEGNSFNSVGAGSEEKVSAEVVKEEIEEEKFEEPS